MTEIDGEQLRDLSDQTIQRYGERLDRLGVTPQTLGWGSIDHQRVRFAAVRSLIELKDKSILDWGCGFGDLLDDLLLSGTPFRSYVGIDLNPDFVLEARRRFEGESTATFEIADSHRPFPPVDSADVVIMLGLANFKQTVVDTEAYARALLHSGFEACRHAVICDFLSSVPTPGYAREESVHYYRPETVLRWGLELSTDVVLKHDYAPIPQREMLMKVSRT